MKPIFIIKIPRQSPPELWEHVSKYFNNNEDIQKDYHIMIVGGKNEEIEHECFNSPYSPEEFTKLQDLIDKINKDYEQRD
jgi:thioredoxin reductase